MLSRLPALLFAALATLLIAPSARAELGLVYGPILRGDFVVLGAPLGQDCAAGVPLPRLGEVGPCGANLSDSALDVLWRSEANSAAASISVGPAEARSTAMLALPADASVAFARLYWGASGVAPDTSARLERPGVFNTPVTALQGRSNANGYQASADVTDLVRTHGAGAYRVSGVGLADPVDADNAGSFAAWWMAVVYERPGDPLRIISLHDGLATIDPDHPDGAYLWSWTALPHGRVAVVAYEGDQDTPGDQLWFEDEPLSGPENVEGNSFNSSRSGPTGAVSNAGDLPRLSGAAGSMSGLDVDVFDVSQLLKSDRNFAHVQATTTSDVFEVAGMLGAFDVQWWELKSVPLVAVDVNGGEVVIGDTVRYTVSATNTGNAPVEGLAFQLPLPSGLAYVPGSLALNGGPNAGAKTDVSGDDQAEFDATAYSMRFRPGTDAEGRTLGAGQSFSLSFSATTRSLGTIAAQGTVSTLGARGVITVPTRGDNGDVEDSRTLIFVQECSAHVHCSGPMPLCDTASAIHACVGCLGDADCTGALTNACRNGFCTCVASGPEICDGKDNDCNRVIDETFPGAGEACATTSPGVCTAGSMRCQDGATACVSTWAPGSLTEVCNALDDDCDGTADEGLGLGQPCSVGVGACASPGVTACNNAGTVLCSAVAGSPAPERCANGIDDDCDGTVDEECGASDAGSDAAVMHDPGADAGVRLDAGLPTEAGHSLEAGEPFDASPAEDVVPTDDAQDNAEIAPEPAQDPTPDEEPNEPNRRGEGCSIGRSRAADLSDAAWLVGITLVQLARRRRRPA